MCIVGVGLGFFATELLNLTEPILIKIPSDMLPDKLFMDQGNGAGGGELIKKPSNMLPDNLFMDQGKGAGGGEHDPGLSSGTSKVSAAERVRVIEERMRLREEELAQTKLKMEKLKKVLAEEADEQARDKKQN